MVQRLALRSATASLAGLIATAGLVASADAHTEPPVPLAKAGTLIGWSAVPEPDSASAPGPTEPRTLPSGLQNTAISKLIANSDFTLGLTAGGKVFVLGETGAGGASVAAIPDSLATATVTDIATGGVWAGAITSEGKVVVWGQEIDDAPEPTDVPEGLTGVAKLAIGDGSAAAVKTNGEVVMWGRNVYGDQNGKPDTLTGVKALTAGTNHYYALKNDGSVVAWGNNSNGQTTLPPAVAAGNVKAIEARYRGGLALMNDGSLDSWGQFANADEFDPAPPLDVPASLTGKNVIAIAASASQNLAVENDGTMTYWSSDALTTTEMSHFPSELADADIVGVSLGARYGVALVSKVLAATKASVGGSPTIGQTLTGTPATFSGAPDAVTNQWLADGVAIAGATGPTLSLTDAYVGKRITFASTATKAGVDPVVSTSEPTAAVPPVAKPGPPAVVLVTSKPIFKANKVPTSKKKGKATVTVPTVSGRAKATGKATVTIKKGRTTKKITVSLSGGKRSISLPKLKKGTWKVQVSYNGDKNYVAQKSKSYNLKIKK